MALPVKPNIPDDPNNRPVVPPVQAPQQPVFNSSVPAPEKGLLAVGEGLQEAPNAPRYHEEVVVVATPKRIRTTTGQLTSEDILTKSYDKYYSPLEEKIVEVTTWTQKTLSDNDKNTEISVARRERGHKYEDMAAFIDNLLVRHFASANVVRSQDAPLIIAAVINEILGLGPIEPLWQDGRISEIMVNGPRDVKVEIGGKLRNVPGARFRDAEHLLNVCQQILGDIGREVNVQKTTADGRLPDGSRINVVHNIIAPTGPFLTIRRFPDTIFTIKELVDKKSMTEEIALEIGNLIYKGCSTVVAGGTGSGKTSALNAFSGAIPNDERVVTIEDNLELRLNPAKHILPMEAKQASSGSNGEGGTSIRDLVKNALRMRPDRIIVGEVRDAAAYDMLQAMSTGHDGSMTTVHANDPEGTIERLTNLISEVGDFSPERALSLIAGGIDIIIIVDRYEDGSRRVASIAEVPSVVEAEGRLTKLTPRIIWAFRQDGIDKVEDEEGVIRDKIFGHYEKVSEISESLIRKHRLDKKVDLTLEELYQLSDIPKDTVITRN